MNLPLPFEDNAHDLNETLAQFCAASPKGSRIAIALSGGLDSIVLIHAMNAFNVKRERPFILSAIHVHHGLSPHAEAWCDFCSEVCRTLNIPLSTVRVSLPPHPKEGVEGAARRLRYAAFSKLDVDYLALAHHRDDELETFLLNLFRGAGLMGMAGMPASRALRPGLHLIRPLMALPRSALKAYALRENLSWIDDESNAELRFRRNFIRHNILPALEGHFPGVRVAMARANALLSESASLLNSLAEIDATQARGASGRILLARLNALSLERGRNLLRYLWTQAGFQISGNRWLYEAQKQLLAYQEDSETCITSADAALRVYRGELYIVPSTRMRHELPKSCQEGAVLGWFSGEVRFIATEGQGIRLSDFILGSPTLKMRGGGERIQIHQNRPRRSVRNLMQEAQIPPWERVELPYLWLGDKLAWVGTLGIDCAFLAGPNEKGILPIWVHPDT